MESGTKSNVAGVDTEMDSETGAWSDRFVNGWETLWDGSGPRVRMRSTGISPILELQVSELAMATLKWDLENHAASRTPYLSERAAGPMWGLGHGSHQIEWLDP